MFVACSCHELLLLRLFVAVDGCCCCWCMLWLSCVNVLCALLVRVEVVRSPWLLCVVGAFAGGCSWPLSVVHCLLCVVVVVCLMVDGGCGCCIM